VDREIPIPVKCRESFAVPPVLKLANHKQKVSISILTSILKTNANNLPYFIKFSIPEPEQLSSNIL